MTTEEPKTYASEGNHWYFPDGTPCHEVPYSDPKRGMRPTTLRDARKLGLYPSVSGILGIMGKPGLDYWKKEQVAKTAYGIGVSGPYEEEDEYVSYLLERAEKNMTVARDLGTEVHGAINRHFKGEDVEEKYDPYIKAAVKALKELGVWDEIMVDGGDNERSFASPLGFGGAIDLSGVSTKWVVDWKAIDNLGKKFDYPERCAQIAAYLMGKYGTLDVRFGANVAISTNEPGTYDIRIWTKEELEYGWELFLACKKLWEISNRYAPSAASVPPKVGTEPC